MREAERESLPSQDRPLTVGAAWRLALAFYRENFFAFFGIALIASLLGRLLGYLFTSESQSPLVGLLASMPGLTAESFGYYALAKAILDRLRNQPTHLRDAYGFALDEAGPILLTLAWILGLVIAPILIAIGLAALSPLLGFLGIFASFIALFLVLLFTAFISFVFVEEGVYGWEGIRRSYELVCTDWGSVLVVQLLIVFPPLLLGLLLPESWFVAGLEALYYPLPFAALALLYLDIRKDRGELL